MTYPQTDKQPWDFDRNLTDPELRKARAAEYTAHYLERIESHLERIAIALDQGVRKMK